MRRARPAPTVGNPFRVVSDFAPAGDQPKAVVALAEGVDGGDRFQTLLGITGSGKSATIAWTIEKVQRPTLVLAPNKSLAAQLANEFREFFPDNRVEYFVSYYDYYQPEAYMPSSDTYTEKDSPANDDIYRLPHPAPAATLDTTYGERSPGPPTPSTAAPTASRPRTSRLWPGVSIRPPLPPKAPPVAVSVPNASVTEAASCTFDQTLICPPLPVPVPLASRTAPASTATR